MHEPDPLRPKLSVSGGDAGNVAAGFVEGGNEIGCQAGQSIELAACPAVLDRDIAAFGETGFIEPATKCCREIGAGFGRAVDEKPDDRHRCLLRTRRERPRGCRTAEQRDELASFHSITSSAMASSDGGTVMPSILAVSALMNQLELRRLHDRQVRRLCALEDAADIAADLPSRVVRVASVAHQPPNFGVVTP